jgi:NAD(P)H-dependent FMN reductase
MGNDEKPLSLPVILGTPRKGRQSEHVARFVLGEIEKRPGIETELIDVTSVPVPADDAGTGAKDPEFAARMQRADGLVLVVPEYNHSFPGALKSLLDTCLEEYIHKAAGIVGVSAGPFGGARAIESLLPVLRELGLVTTFSDVNVGRVAHVFDDSGALQDEAYVRRTKKFLDELVWMARVLRHGRENLPA